MQITEGVIETLNANAPVTLVQRMNNIHARAEEIVQKELIYT